MRGKEKKMKKQKETARAQVNAYEFTVFEMDVFLEDGDWVANGWHKLGILSVNAAEGELEQGILLALEGFDIGRSYPALDTHDRRRVFCESDDGEWFEVGAVKQHKPIYGLRLDSFNGNPIEEI